MRLSPTETGFQVHEQFRRTDLGLDIFQDNIVVVNDHAYTFPYRCGPLCLSLKTGKTLWGGERLARESARRKTALTFADGHLIARQSDGVVQLIEATAQGYTEEGEFTIPDHAPSIGSTSPVIADGRLYLRDDNRLFCYDVRREAVESPRPEPRAITLNIGSGRDSEAPKLRKGPRSVFVPTPHDVVEKMLGLADVEKKSLVYDLGSGDGRIVIAAAKNHGCRAVGYEIDKELVTLSREQVAKAGVAELVAIERGDIFDVDLKQADVVAVYLLPKQLELLIPQFQKLKPGARIVSHQFEIPGIKPDRTIEVKSTEDGDAHKIHIWTAPISITK